MAQSPRAPDSREVLVICIAGLDARFLAQPPTRLRIPNIRRLMRDGASATGVIGVAPSDSVPSENALMTGVPPDEQGEPLWRLTAQSGIRTAAIDWPAAGGSALAFNFPPGRNPASGHDIPFDSVAAQSTPPGIADTIETASPGFEKQLWDDTSSARAATWVLGNRKADVVFVSFTDVDSIERETGALSIYARDALENDDDLIGQMIAKCAPGTILALVSGHGFENENYVVRPRVLLKQVGMAGSVEVKDGLIGTDDAAVAARLRQLMKDGKRHGIAREVPMSEVRAVAPSLSHWVAAFDTPTNYVAVDEDSGPALGPGTHLGVSGLWPTRPGYRSVFILAGKGVSARRLGEIDLLQIAPTLAGAIGVKLSGASKASLWATVSH